MKKSILTVAGVGIGALVLYTLSQAKQVLDSIDFYISSIELPEFEPGYLKVPVTLSFVNFSNFNIKLDQVMISVYRMVDGQWQRIGTSNPGTVVSIPSGQTSSVTVKPRISLLQGLFPSLNIFLRTGYQNLRIGVRVKVAGQFMPEQFKEFPVGKIRNGIV